MTSRPSRKMNVSKGFIAIFLEFVHNLTGKPGIGGTHPKNDLPAFNDNLPANALMGFCLSGRGALAFEGNPKLLNGVLFPLPELPERIGGNARNDFFIFASVSGVSVGGLPVDCV